MVEKKAEILLETPVELAWSLAADFSLFHHWNPLFTGVSGIPATGATVELTIALPPLAPFPLPVTIGEILPKTRIAWHASYLSRHLFTWEYECRIEPAGESVRFLQRSRFRGVLAPLFGLALGRPLQEGMERYGEAMKRWGERKNISCLKC